MLEKIFDTVRLQRVINRYKKSINMMSETIAELEDKYEEMKELCEHYKEVAIELSNEKRNMKKEIARLKENDKKGSNSK